MKIYLAARYSRHLEMQEQALALIRMGHDITSRWIWGNHSLVDHSMRSTQEQAERTRFAQEDLEDVNACDTVIFFSEEPRTPTRGARHVEFGIALGQGKRIMVVGGREHIFHELPHIDVEHYPSFAAAYNELMCEKTRDRQDREYLEALEWVNHDQERLEPNAQRIVEDFGFVPPPEARSLGNKEDHKKLPYHLMSTHALREYAEVLKFGAEKPEYGPRNWEKGMEYSRLYSAMWRHLQAWWSGEAMDNGEGGTGRTHLGGALFSLAALIHFECEGMIEWDDRPFQEATVNESVFDEIGAIEIADPVEYNNTTRVPAEWPEFGSGPVESEFSGMAPTPIYERATMAGETYGEWEERKERLRQMEDPEVDLARQAEERFTPGHPRAYTGRVTLDHVRPGATPEDDAAYLEARNREMFPEQARGAVGAKLGEGEPFLQTTEAPTVKVDAPQSYEWVTTHTGVNVAGTSTRMQAYVPKDTVV